MRTLFRSLKSEAAKSRHVAANSIRKRSLGISRQFPAGIPELEFAVFSRMLILAFRRVVLASGIRGQATC